MRKWWWWFAVLVITVAAIIWLSPPRRTELDELQAFNPTILRGQVSYSGSPPGSCNTLEYTFPKESADLVADWLIAHEDPKFGSLHYDVEGAGIVWYDPQTRSLTVLENTAPSWLERQWTAVRVRLGVERPTGFVITPTK